MVFIFDLDGTLVDSTEQIFNSVNTIRARYGFSRMSQDEVLSRIGLPVNALFDEPVIDELTLQLVIMSFREDLKYSVKSGNVLFKGVKIFLERCIHVGLELAVATSKPHDLAEQVIQNSELKNFIRIFQGIDGFPGKPNPEVILRVMEKSSDANFIMFGDRVEDAKASSAASIPFVGIAQTSHSLTDLKDAGAALVFQNFKEANNNFGQIIKLYDGQKLI